MPNWNEVFNEIQSLQMQGLNAQNMVRTKYLNALHKHTKRNVIAYYSGWLSKGSVFKLTHYRKRMTPAERDTLIA